MLGLSEAVKHAQMYILQMLVRYGTGSPRPLKRGDGYKPNVVNARFAVASERPNICRRCFMDFVASERPNVGSVFRPAI